MAQTPPHHSSARTTAASTEKEQKPTTAQQISQPQPRFARPRSISSSGVMAKPYATYASPVRSSSSSSSLSSEARSPATSPPSLSLNSSPHAAYDQRSVVQSQLGSSSLSGSSRFLPSRNLMGGGGGAARSLRKTRSIVVLGFSCVGKTALCVRFVNDRFEEAYEPTYENSFVKVFNHHGTEMECIIKDTQGVGEQEIFRNEYGLGVHGYVLVYSIASQRSFDIVQTINNKLINLMGTRLVPRVLIGNKIDLSSGSMMRQVSTEAGQALADSWNCAFMECSAKNDVNIDRAFSTLLDEIERASEPEPTHDMRRCWRSLFCCCRGRDSDLDFSSSSSSALSPLASSADLAAQVERWTNVSRATTWMVLLLALGGLVGAIVLGVRTSDSQTELLSYILAGFAFLVWLLSLVSLYGMRTSSAEYLKAFCISLSILVVSEIIVWILLLLNIQLFADHVLFCSLAGAATLALQVGACEAARRLAKAMSATSTGGSPYLSADYHSAYHSLYE